MGDQWLIYEGQTTALDFGAVDALKLGIASGNVTIIGHDEPTTRVEVTRVVGAELKISSDFGGLRIEHFKGHRKWNPLAGWFSGAQVDLTVLLPQTAKLKLGNVSANLVISGVSGTVKSSTVSGSMTLDNGSGAVDLNSVSGEISIINHTANGHKVDINTVSGAVTVNGDISRLDLNSVSADATLDLTGPISNIQINQVSGNVVARFDQHPLRYELHGKNSAVIDGIPQPRDLNSIVFNERAGGNIGKVEINSAFGTVSVVHRAE